MLEMIHYNDLNLSNSGGCILVKVVMVMVGGGGGGGGPPKPPKTGSWKAQKLG